ncbi:YVTN family beta-propeller protein [Leifsonia sp. EB41]|uniref:FG-GAP-like repeat-containing protein n=1 Tax=Leifsonia sp. EB41 TaxID=3156260 RepID=UPI0035118A02
MAIDTGRHLAYILTGPANLSDPVSVTVIDEGKRTTVGSIPVSSGVTRIAVDSTRHVIYAVDSTKNTLSVIDDVSGSVTRVVPLAFRPCGIAVDTQRNVVYLTDFAGAAVYIVDGSSGTVTGSIPTDTDPEYVAVNETTGVVYAETGSHGFAGDVDVLDPASRTVTARVPVQWSQQMVVNPVTNRVYIPTGLAVAILDGATNTGSSLLPTNWAGTTGVDLVAVNPATDDVAYLTPNGADAIDMAKGIDPTVTQELPELYHPQAAAIDPVTGDMLVTDNTNYYYRVEFYAPMAFVSDPPASTLVPEKQFSTVVTTNSTVSPTYTVTSGALPTGLQLNSTTGVLSGVPTARGAFTFTITCADQWGNSISQEYSQTVEGADYVPPVRAHDFSGDQKADVLARDTAGDFIRYRGNGAGGWLTPASAPIGSGWNGMTSIVVPGDFDGDGNADVLARDAAGRLWLYPGNGTGGWKARELVGSGWNGMAAIVAAGDFNSDGFQDVLAVDGSGVLWEYPGDGHGGWLPRQQIGSGWGAMTAIVGVGDFNGDGFPDLLVRNPAGALLLYPHTPTGWLTPKQVGSGWNVMTSIQSVGDFTGDGFTDVLARDTGGSLWLYPGNGASGFGAPSRVGSGWNIMNWIG